MTNIPALTGMSQYRIHVIFDNEKHNLQSVLWKLVNESAEALGLYEPDKFNFGDGAKEGWEAKLTRIE